MRCAGGLALAAQGVDAVGVVERPLQVVAQRPALGRRDVTVAEIGQRLAGVGAQVARLAPLRHLGRETVQALFVGVLLLDRP